jgi:hypothetical protein
MMDMLLRHVHMCRISHAYTRYDPCLHSRKHACKHAISHILSSPKLNKYQGLHGKQAAHLVLVDCGLHQLLGTHPAAFGRSMTLSTVLGTAHTHQLVDSRCRAALHLVLVF